MTLPLNSRLSALYDTNGTQKEFSFGFRVFFDPDNGGYGLEVRRQTADGYEVIPKSDYLVLPVEDNSAGVVRFSVAPSAGQQIYIAGKTPTIQQLVLTNFGRYSAESIETQFDFITAIIQEWLSALDEETRQRIAADEILTQYVVQRIDDFVQQVNQNWDDKSQEIEGYIATIMPSFTQTLRDEIEAFAVTGMQDAIDQTLAYSKSEIDDAVSRANAAATAAAITVKLYDTPQAGVDPVTGVAYGSYFNVRSSRDESYVDEYQNVGGRAVATGKSYPSISAILELKESINNLKTDKIDVIESELAYKAAKSYVDIRDTSLQLQIDQKATTAYLDSALAEQTQTVNTSLSQLSTAATKFYPTLAEANTDIANVEVNQPVQVGDSGANGGLWYKATAEATTLTKSAYDPLSQAKNYTDAKVSFSDEPDLKQEIDAEGKIYARYAKNGDLYLTGMDGISVQEKFKSSPEYNNTVKEDLASFEDPDGAIFLRIDSDSGLHLVGQNGSVQENMALIAPKITNIRRDKRYFFIDEVQPYLNNLVASGMGFAPIPITLMPSKFTVPSSITNLKLIPPTGYIPLDSPYYKNDQVVHPFIFECVGTMRGYRYILSINPYTYEIHENPVIYGSNDLENFEMLTGFTQPLDTPPEGGFLSDTGFTYDPELGELICYWRVTRRPSDGLVYTSYWCKRTKDLMNWTEKEQFFPELENGVDGLTSPAFLFDPKTGLWHLWNIKQEGTVVHRTAPSLFGPWSASEVIAGASLTTPWHIEVKWCGDKMLMLINRSKSNSNYFLGISSDGTNWTFGSSPMFDVQLDALYKATFIPNLDSSNNFYLDVFYTTNHTVDPDLKRRLFHVQSNTIVI